MLADIAEDVPALDAEAHARFQRPALRSREMWYICGYLHRYDETGASTMTRPGISIDELDTPCLLVDLERMERNIRTWQAAISAGGADLRPHVKTHKVPAIA